MMATSSSAISDTAAQSSVLLWTGFQMLTGAGPAGEGRTAGSAWCVSAQVSPERGGDGFARPCDAALPNSSTRTTSCPRSYIERLCRLGDACAELQAYVDESAARDDSLYRTALCQGLSGLRGVRAPGQGVHDFEDCSAV